MPRKDGRRQSRGFADFYHLLSSAGNASLMTAQLRAMLCDHAAGNYRILTTMAAQLLAAALQRQASVIDEKLYFEVFSDAKRPATAKPRARPGRGHHE